MYYEPVSVAGDNL